jgi:hypothetical protein
MRFGLFASAEAPRSAGGDPGRGFRRYIETNVEAEQLGFHSTFLVEHHFSRLGQVSASLDLLSWVAARTSAIRVGTAVVPLPWHDPVLLAERAATLDLLSAGRLDVGVASDREASEDPNGCPVVGGKIDLRHCAFTGTPSLTPRRRRSGSARSPRIGCRLAAPGWKGYALGTDPMPRPGREVQLRLVVLRRAVRRRNAPLGRHRRRPNRRGGDPQ